MHKKKKKRRKIGWFFLDYKKLPAYFYIAEGLVVFLLMFVVLLFLHQGQSSIYIFPENPKQGETVFIRVKSSAQNVTGSFTDGKVLFFKKQLNADKSTEWVSFLGIDADQRPGNYKIIVNVSPTEKLSKDVEVSLAGFSSESAVESPTVSSNGTTKTKAVENIVKNDNPPLNEVLSNFTTTPYFDSSFSFPLSKIKKTGLLFGEFISFGKDKLQHLGADLSASKDTEVYAVNSGKIVAVLNLSNYGKTVIIDHGLDIFSLYLHLDKFKVEKGEMVKKGQIIGLSGDTGYVTAPHLHFSIRVGTARVDPIAFIETTQKMNDSLILADISNAFLNIFNLK